MPGGSLNPVEQRFSADASGYIAEIGKIIRANREVLDSIREIQQVRIDVDTSGALAKIAALKAELGSLGDRNITVSVKYVSTGDAPDPGDVTRTVFTKYVNVGDAAGGGGNSFLRDYNQMLDQYDSAARDAAEANRVFNASQEDGVRLGAEAAESLQNLRSAFGLTKDSATAAQMEIARGFVAEMPLLDQMVSRLGVAKDAYASLGDASRPLQYAAADIEKLNSALAVTERRASSFATAFYGEGGASRGGAGSLEAGGIGGGAGAGAWPAVAQGGGDGGGGGGWAAAAVAALRPSAIFGNALPTVKMAHMITMFTMESLSTIIPAAVAAGAAGAVGLQGGTNVYTTGTGLYNATEALGGAYGKTFGSYLGLGSSFQAAQNMANGGVYGITGGVLNLAGQGRDAFSSMGVQTVAMIDRGIAAMVLNNRMGAVGAALAGGTGDLRSFGDIGANLGDTLLNMAPSLPGLGPDMLTGLKGITGALASTTGFLGKTGLLAPMLAAEAGYRWGDLALAGGKMPWFLGGKQVSGLSGVASRMGLGELPMTTDEAVAAGLGSAEELGAGGVAGTGLAGVLAGGMAGVPPVGLMTALAALTAWGGVKLASTMPTKAQRQVGALQGRSTRPSG